MRKVLLTILLLTISIVSCDVVKNSSSIFSSSNTSSSTSSKPSSSSSSTSITKIKTNLIRNGDFSSNEIIWNKYEGGGSVALSIENGVLKADVRCGNGIYEPRLDVMNLNFEIGKTYLVEFKAKTNGINKTIQVQSGELIPYDPWFSNFGLAELYFITSEWQTFNGVFTHNSNNKRGGLIFEIGQQNGLRYTLYLDDIIIYEVDDSYFNKYNLNDVEGEPIITNVPTIYVNTINNQQVPYDKNIYVDGTFNLVDGENPFLNINDLSLRIRARGNSSLWMPKRSYRIKFNKAVDLYGMNKNKDWVLLANHADKSLIRNYLAFELGSKLSNLEYTPQCMFVNFYFNNNYEGLYLLATQIETGTNRVNIEYDYTNDDIDIPFLIEWDNRLTNPNENNGAIEGIDYFVVDWIPFGLKYPDSFNEMTYNQKRYIYNYMNNVHTSILNRKNYDSFIDVDSFIDYFIVQELFKNVDMGFASVFMYKEKGGKLKFGPLWDFDLSIGNADYIDYSPYNWFSQDYSGNPWFNSLMKHPTFKKQFTKRFNEVKNTIIQDLIDSVDIIGRDLYEHASNNFERWKTLGKYDWPNPPKVVAASTYDEQIYYVKNYLIERVKWMDYVLNE